MDNFDLSAALLQYRKREGNSLEKMGSKLNMSRSAYYRLESGTVKPSYDRAKEIMEFLDIEEPVPDAAVHPPARRKWYRSKKWRWVIPIVISYLFLSLITETVGFRAGYGEEEFINNPPDGALMIVGAVFCAFYYYFYPPEWPFGKPRQ